jgi:HEAT repeat protein
MEPPVKTAVPALVEALKDENAQVRAGAASALGTIGPEAKVAVSSLTELVQDRDEIVRSEAAAALKKIDPDAAKKAEGKGR